MVFKSIMYLRQVTTSQVHIYFNGSICYSIIFTFLICFCLLMGLVRILIETGTEITLSCRNLLSWMKYCKIAINICNWWWGRKKVIYRPRRNPFNTLIIILLSSSTRNISLRHFLQTNVNLKNWNLFFHSPPFLDTTNVLLVCVAQSPFLWKYLLPHLKAIRELVGDGEKTFTFFFTCRLSPPFYGWKDWYRRWWLKRKVEGNRREHIVTIII